MSCCGNRDNTERVCGEFETPTTPDAGQCQPYRTKKDCEAPVVPSNPCNDTNAYAIYTPGEVPPFTIVTTLFDEDCDAILDEDSNPIMVTTS